MKRSTHVTITVLLTLMIAKLVGSADPDPPAKRKTMADRHHLLYGVVALDATDAPFETPGGLLVCLSCHEIDACTNQILIERGCRVCHQQDRHHVLYNTAIPDPTDAPFEAPGELLVCLSCHEHKIDTKTGENQFLIERDCRVCHQPNKNKPVAVDDFYIMEDNSILHVPAPGVLRNDSDADGESLAARLVSDVNFGVLKLLPDGAFSYTPEIGFAGNDSFTYVAHDGLNDSEIARVTITVEEDVKIVIVDIMPDSDHNPTTLCSTEVLPVTILGSADCDVTEIDASSLLLEGQVAPLLWRLEDEEDGYLGLKLEFDPESVNNALQKLRVGQMHEVWITGTLMDGTPIMGSDFIVVVPWSSLNKDEGPDDQEEQGP